MLAELDTKYEKISKKNNYDPQNEDEKKGKRRNNNHGTTLTASGNVVLKDICYVCGNWGYRREQYPFRNGGNTENGQNTHNTQNTPNTSHTNNSMNTNYHNNANPNLPRLLGKYNY